MRRGESGRTVDRMLARACALAVVGILATATPTAATGRRDPGFGDGGTAIVGFGETDAAAGDVEAMADGRLVIAGLADGFAVARLTRGGKLDPTFGNGDGRVVVAGFGTVTRSFAYPGLALYPDGSAVVAGGTEVRGARTIALARFDPSGALDPGFGADGKVTVTVQPAMEEQARDVAIQPDGKIVVVGDSGSLITIVRLNPDGTRDTGFGSGGAVVLAPAPGSPSSAPGGVAVQPDGRIVVAGGTLLPETAFDAFFLRLQPNGTLDDAFGEHGVRIVALGPGGALDSVVAHGVALLPDGRIVGTGFSLTTLSSGPLALARLLPDGTPDPTLGPSGTRTIELGPGYDRAGGVVATGSTLYVAADSDPQTGDPRRLFIVALNVDGSPDETFARNGIMEVAIRAPAGSRDAAGLARRPDGRLALLVRMGGSGRHGFGVALVDPDPAPPPTGAAGRPRSRIGPVGRRPRRIAGTAEAPAGVARVDVAVIRRARRGGRPVCELLRSRAVRFQRVSVRRDGACTKRIWLRAAGTSPWVLRLRRALPRGRYVALSRATDLAGRREGAFTRLRGNRISFRVR